MTSKEQARIQSVVLRYLNPHLLADCPALHHSGTAIFEVTLPPTNAPAIRVQLEEKASALIPNIQVTWNNNPFVWSQEPWLRPVLRGWYFEFILPGSTAHEFDPETTRKIVEMSAHELMGALDD